jgi:hypothetical protein
MIRRMRMGECRQGSDALLRVMGLRTVRYVGLLYMMNGTHMCRMTDGWIQA